MRRLFEACVYLKNDSAVYIRFSRRNVTENCREHELIAKESGPGLEKGGETEQGNAVKI